MKWLLVLLCGCATVHCRTDADCRLHPRECQVKLDFPCANCAGRIYLCAVRPREELRVLDDERRRCATGDFSYDEGCMCSGKPCRTERQRCEDRGGIFHQGEAQLPDECLTRGELIR
jgi:hypothetical protein